MNIKYAFVHAMRVKIHNHNRNQCLSIDTQNYFILAPKKFETGLRKSVYIMATIHGIKILLKEGGKSRLKIGVDKI